MKVISLVVLVILSLLISCSQSQVKSELKPAKVFTVNGDSAKTWEVVYKKDEEGTLTSMEEGVHSLHKFTKTRWVHTMFSDAYKQPDEISNYHYSYDSKDSTLKIDGKGLILSEYVKITALTDSTLTLLFRSPDGDLTIGLKPAPDYNLNDTN